MIRSLVAHRGGTRRTGPQDGTSKTGPQDGTQQDGEAGAGWRYTLGTGGGITVRSDVDEEWAETRWKAARLRSPL